MKYYYTKEVIVGADVRHCETEIHWTYTTSTRRKSIPWTGYQRTSEWGKVTEDVASNIQRTWAHILETS